MQIKLDLDDELAFKLSEAAHAACRTTRGQAQWYVRAGAEQDYRGIVEQRELQDTKATVAA